MKKFNVLLIAIFLIVFFSFSLKQCFSANFFADSVTTGLLKSKYKKAQQKGGEKIRILLVPGHDADYWGTSYKGVKEADLNYEMTLQVQKLFASKKEFEIIVPRDKNQYKEEFRNYFENKRPEITQFRKESKQMFTNLENAGAITTNDNVYHNAASEETANRLFGLNKWANENKIDLVLHIHINDTPERKYNKPGKYKGFVVYVPDSQFSNGGASIKMGQSIFKQINKYFIVSNMNKESAGVVEDQKLIALGASNTLMPAAALIEYGYIYRPLIINPKTRPALFKKMAEQTVVGVVNFLKGK